MGEGADLNGNNTTEGPPYKHLTIGGEVVVSSLYLTGIVGSLLAFYMLSNLNTRYKNKKHSLMLRCLLGLDLVALLGMSVQMYIQLHATQEISASYPSCVVRVIWRWFGLGSGCVSIVMAVERWLALAHPFFYHKNVTYNRILKAIFGLWIAAFALVCMPFFHFGLYYNEELHKCQRYRVASKAKDIAYAYLYFVFGLLICTGITCANLSVTKYLCFPSTSRSHTAGRRISRKCYRQKSQITVQTIESPSSEELAFAKLMVAFSVLTVLCWAPLLICIPLSQILPEEKTKGPFFRLADVLIAIHFTLDPYIYVLLHHNFSCRQLLSALVPKHFRCSNNTVDANDEEQSGKFISKTTNSWQYSENASRTV